MSKATLSSHHQISKRPAAIGLLLAPGREDDLAVNQYVKTTVAQGLSKFFPVYARLPEDNIESIKSNINYLIKNNCKYIVNIGHQSKVFIEYLIGVSEYFRSVTYIHIDSPSKIPTNLKSPMEGVTKLDPHHFLIDHKENEIATSLMLCIREFVRVNDSIFNGRVHVALFCGANVPIVHKWKSGIEIYDKNKITLHSFYLGDSYANFNNERDAFHLADYVLSSYKIDIFIEILGASVFGLLRRLRMESQGNQILVPFDYASINSPMYDQIIIPFTTVRRIENSVLKLINTLNASAYGLDSDSDLEVGAIESHDLSHTNMKQINPSQISHNNRGVRIGGISNEF